MGSRCCELPSGSCTRSSGSSSCIQPPQVWCCCRMSDRSCSGCAKPTPNGPELELLDGRTERRKIITMIFRKHVKCRTHQTSCFSQEQKRCLWEKEKRSSPASSSVNFSRSLLGDFGKEQFFSLQRLSSSASSSSVPTANQAGGSWTPSSAEEEEGFLFFSTPRKMSMVAGFSRRSLTASYLNRHNFVSTCKAYYSLHQRLDASKSHPDLLLEG